MSRIICIFFFVLWLCWSNSKDEIRKIVHLKLCVRRGKSRLNSFHWFLKYFPFVTKKKFDLTANSWSHENNRRPKKIEFFEWVQIFVSSVFNAIVLLYFTIKVAGYLGKNVKSLQFEWNFLELNPCRSVGLERSSQKLNPNKYK